MFGATGDLARRKLLPGLLHLSCSKLAPEMRVIGTSLDEMDSKTFREEVAHKACKEFAHHTDSDELFDQFVANLTFVSSKTARRLWRARWPSRLRHSAARLACCTT